jgi:DNA replication protein DnaC
MCKPTGVGKSNLANAINIEAIKHNYWAIAKPMLSQVDKIQKSYIILSLQDNIFPAREKHE